MPVAIRSSGGGATTLVATSSPTDYTATLPANSGTVVTTGSTAVVSQAMLASNVGGNGPAFSASGNGQTLSSGVTTKLQFTTELFDTNNNFDSTTNYRFTPTVAGYYQINGVMQVASSYTAGYLMLYKNGSQFAQGLSLNASGGAFTLSFLVPMNGTTDYLELYGYIGTGQALVAGNTLFQGFLARSA